MLVLTVPSASVPVPSVPMPVSSVTVQVLSVPVPVLSKSISENEIMLVQYMISAPDKVSVSRKIAVHRRHEKYDALQDKYFFFSKIPRERYDSQLSNNV